MTKTLLDALDSARRPRVLVVGDLILDKYVWGEAERISPEAPTPVVLVREQDSRAGGAGNVANALACLDALVSCCGIVGDDAPGRHLSEMLQRICEGRAHILTDGSRPTSVKTRFGAYVQSARRGMQHILRVDEEDARPIDEGLSRRIAETVQRAVSAQDAVILSDYKKGLLTPEVIRGAIEGCAEARIPVIVDPRRDQDYSLYRGATLITPNRYETQLATGIAVQEEADMLRAARRLQEDLGLRAAILTLDRDGMYLYEAGAPEGEHIRNEPREITDITGAGDMVVAVLALMMGAGADLHTAAELANVAAGIEVGKIGAAPVYRSEIRSRLRALEHGPSAKVKALPELLEILDERRRRRQKIVMTNGCFDLLHIGHIEYLKFARRQGDLLVVGMNSDRSVRALKGPQRPILRQEDRAGLLAGLEDVDFVTIFEETSAETLVKAIRPDVLVKGEDWREKGVVGREFVESYGGRVVLAPLVEGISSSEIVARILERYGNASMNSAPPAQK